MGVKLLEGLGGYVKRASSFILEREWIDYLMLLLAVYLPSSARTPSAGLFHVLTLTLVVMAVHEFLLFFDSRHNSSVSQG